MYCFASIGDRDTDFLKDLWQLRQRVFEFGLELGIAHDVVQILEHRVKTIQCEFGFAANSVQVCDEVLKVTFFVFKEIIKRTGQLRDAHRRRLKTPRSVLDYEQRFVKPGLQVAEIRHDLHWVRFHDGVFDLGFIPNQSTSFVFRQWRKLNHRVSQKRFRTDRTNFICIDPL